jgi:putative SOS response-associated peptidase YedK
MCGRYALHANPAVVALQFHLAAVPTFAPRYNIAPAARVLAIKPDAAVVLRWGFRGKAHNIRAETLRGRRRCLIPASGFYEWRKVAAGKQAYYVRPARDSLFGLAGIWDGETCAILTVEANRALLAIHHRMPAIVARQDYARWLGGDDGLLGPAPDDETLAYAVGPQINSGSAESSRLIEPLPSGVALAGRSGGLFGDD